MKNLLHLAIKNILNYRKKSFSAVLSIASGFLALNLFQSYIYDVTLIFNTTYSHRNMYGDALIRHHKRHSLISVKEQETIDNFLVENKNQILNHVKNLYFSGTANTGSQQFYFLGLGYELDKGEELRTHYWKNNALYGRPLNSRSERKEIVIGDGFAKSIGCEPPKRIIIPIQKNGYKHQPSTFTCPFSSLQLSSTTVTGQVNALDTSILGIIDGLFKEVDDRLVVGSLSFAQSLLNTKEISYYSLKLHDPELDLSLLAEKFNRLGLSNDLTLQSWKNFDIGDFYQQSLSFLTLFKNFFSIIVITISTLSVMATFYRLINERKKEIGIYRSIGFKSLYIFKLFLLESFLLSLIGVSVGLLFSLIVSSIFNGLSIPYSLGMLTQPVAFNMTLNLKIILFSSLVMVFSSIVFACYPVFKAMKLKITEILIDA